MDVDGERLEDEVMLVDHEGDIHHDPDDDAEMIEDEYDETVEVEGDDMEPEPSDIGSNSTPLFSTTTPAQEASNPFFAPPVVSQPVAAALESVAEAPAEAVEEVVVDEEGEGEQGYEYEGEDGEEGEEGEEEADETVEGVEVATVGDPLESTATPSVHELPSDAQGVAAANSPQAGPSSGVATGGIQGEGVSEAASETANTALGPGGKQASITNEAAKDDETQLEGDEMAPKINGQHKTEEDEEDYDDEADLDIEEEAYPQDVHSLPAIIVHLPDLGARALFVPLPESENQLKLPVWLKGKNVELGEASLADLWSAIRAELAKENLGKNEEMIMTEKQMALNMGEDDINLQSITFLELVQLHHACGLPSPVQLYISFQPNRFSTRFYAIQKEVQKQEERRKSEVAVPDVKPQAEVEVDEDEDEEEYEEEGEEEYVEEEMPETKVEVNKREEDLRKQGKERGEVARAEYGGSRRDAGNDSEHPNADWAARRLIEPIHVQGTRTFVSSPFRPAETIEVVVPPPRPPRLSVERKLADEEEGDDDDVPIRPGQMRADDEERDTIESTEDSQTNMSDHPIASDLPLDDIDKNHYALRKDADPLATGVIPEDEGVEYSEDYDEDTITGPHKDEVELFKDRRARSRQVSPRVADASVVTPLAATTAVAPGVRDPALTTLQSEEPLATPALTTAPSEQPLATPALTVDDEYSDIASERAEIEVAQAKNERALSVVKDAEDEVETASDSIAEQKAALKATESELDERASELDESAAQLKVEEAEEKLEKALEAKREADIATAVPAIFTVEADEVVSEGDYAEIDAIADSAVDESQEPITEDTVDASAIASPTTTLDEDDDDEPTEPIVTTTASAEVTTEDPTTGTTTTARYTEATDDTDTYPLSSIDGESLLSPSAKRRNDADDDDDVVSKRARGDEPI